MTASFKINPDLDLVLERVIDVPRELVWAAWTQPEQLNNGFAHCRGKQLSAKLTCAQVENSVRRCNRQKGNVFQMTAVIWK